MGQIKRTPLDHLGLEARLSEEAEKGVRVVRGQQSLGKEALNGRR